MRSSPLERLYLSRKAGAKQKMIKGNGTLIKSDPNGFETDITKQDI